MEVLLRLEQPADYSEVELLTREAFWNMDLPGRTRCDEHFLAHKIRLSDGFVPELDYVAVAEGRIVGNILYTRSTLLCNDGSAQPMLTFGPLSVLPACQKQGVGGALVRHTAAKAGALGYRGIFIFGHPAYYARFGFTNAAQYHITTETGENFDAFMALPLYEGALSGLAGRLVTHPVYEVDDDEFQAFARAFPPREEARRRPQEGRS